MSNEKQNEAKDCIKNLQVIIYKRFVEVLSLALGAVRKQFTRTAVASERRTMAEKESSERFIMVSETLSRHRQECLCYLVWSLSVT